MLRKIKPLSSVSCGIDFKSVIIDNVMITFQCYYFEMNSTEPHLW